MRISVFYQHIAEAQKQTGRAMRDVLAEVAALGIQGVEMDFASLTAEDALPDRLRGAGLDICAINGFFDFGHDSQAQPGYAMIDEAARLGVARVLVVPGFIRPGETIDQVLPGMMSALRDLCAYAGALGVSVGIEDFDAREAPYSTVGQLHRFFDAVPALKCVFDTGNFIYSEEDAVEAYASLRGHVTAAHLKDRSPVCLTRGDQPIESIMGRRLYPAPVGGGCLPILELLRALRRDGLSGDLAIEHFGAADQMSYIRASAAWLKTAWDMAEKEES